MIKRTLNLAISILFLLTAINYYFGFTPVDLKSCIVVMGCLITSSYLFNQWLNGVPK